MFVGLEAYEAAGGVVMRDLFQQDDGGWLENAGLLDGLVAEKLKAEAETIAAEGWKWIEVAVDVPYGHAHRLRELEGTPADLTAEEQATIDALKAEYAKLEAEYENADELPEEVDERLGEIETALAAFEDRSIIYDPAEIVRAGVFVSIDADGNLSVDRGYVRPEDEAPVAVDGEGDGGVQPDVPDGAGPAVPIVQRTVITIGGQAEPEEDDDDVIKPLPDRLVSELTAHRTLALRDAVGNNPHVAMTALSAQALPRHLPARRVGRLPGSRGAACLLPCPSDGPEGQPVRQGHRRTARGLEGRSAQGRGRTVGLARHPRRGQPGGASGALRVVRRQRPL